jgi:hypothetical protein
VKFSISLLTLLTLVHFQYQTIGRRAITSEEGPKPG